MMRSHVPSCSVCVFLRRYGITRSAVCWYEHSVERYPKHGGRCVYDSGAMELPRELDTSLT